MAEKKFIKGSEEWLLFQDFWKLCQCVWVPEDTEAYWEDFIRRTEEFVDKYGTDFAKELYLALFNDVQRRSGR